MIGPIYSNFGDLSRRGLIAGSPLRAKVARKPASAIASPERGNRKIGKIGKVNGFYVPISMANILT
jgi:hypothetical protein